MPAGLVHVQAGKVIMSSIGRKVLSDRGIVRKEDCTSMKPYFNSVYNFL